MEQLLRERDIHLSLHNNWKRRQKLEIFAKENEAWISFCCYAFCTCLLASCSLKGFFFFVLFGGWFWFLHGWWVVPDCCSAGYTLCKASSRVACTWSMVHMTTTKSGCQRSVLHKCFPQLCYCCHLNDSMSLFFVLSDSAATFGLQSWKKQQASWMSEKKNINKNAKEVKDTGAWWDPKQKQKWKQRGEKNTAAFSCGTLFSHAR